MLVILLGGLVGIFFNFVIQSLIYDVLNKFIDIDFYGNVKIYMYDGFYCVVGIIFVVLVSFDGSGYVQMRMVYDWIGNVIFFLDVNGYVSKFIYNVDYMLKLLIDVFGYEVDYIYDYCNLVIEVDFSSGLIINYSDFDGMNKVQWVMQIVNWGGQGSGSDVYVWWYLIDYVINSIVVIDFNGYMKKIQWDGFDCVQSQVDDLNGLNLIIIYIFDVIGNVVMVFDFWNNDFDIIYIYDGLG